MVSHDQIIRDIVTELIVAVALDLLGSLRLLVFFYFDLVLLGVSHSVCCSTCFLVLFFLTTAKLYNN